MSIDPLVSLGQREWEFIRANLDYLLDPPEPGEEGVVADQSPDVNARLNHLINGASSKRRDARLPDPGRC